MLNFIFSFTPWPNSRIHGDVWRMNKTIHINWLIDVKYENIKYIFVFMHIFNEYANHKPKFLPLETFEYYCVIGTNLSRYNQQEPFDDFVLCKCFFDFSQTFNLFNTFHTFYSSHSCIYCCNMKIFFLFQVMRSLLLYLKHFFRNFWQKQFLKLEFPLGIDDFRNHLSKWLI